VKETDCGFPAGTSTLVDHAFSSAYVAIVVPVELVSVSDAFPGARL
jgi:hypothetical protein